MTGTAIVGFLLVRFLLMPESEWDDEREIEQTVQFIVHGLSMLSHEITCILIQICYTRLI